MTSRTTIAAPTPSTAPRLEAALKLLAEAFAALAAAADTANSRILEAIDDLNEQTGGSR